MRAGRIEQLGPPQELYLRPASMFVADFIGSPAMSFIPFQGPVAPGDRSVRIGEADIAVPEAREGTRETDLVLGARPEHVRLSASAPLRAEVVEAEYLGTTQIVILTTEAGATVRARLPADVQV